MNKLSIVFIVLSIFVLSSNALFSTILKPGDCPVPTGFGICVMACYGDEQCPGSQKCCSNGCGRTCEAPLNSRQCPDTTGLIGLCLIQQDSCLTENDCSHGQMCCPSGCGKKCMNV